jgi:hypothetical protein
MFVSTGCRVRADRVLVRKQTDRVEQTYQRSQRKSTCPTSRELNVPQPSVCGKLF